MNFLIKLCFRLITKHEKEQSNALRVRLSVTTNLNSEVNVTLYRYQVPAVSNDRQNITNVLAVVFVSIMRYFEDPWETCDVNIHEGSDWYFRYDSLRMTKILKKEFLIWASDDECVSPLQLHHDDELLAELLHYPRLTLTHPLVSPDVWAEHVGGPHHQKAAPITSLSVSLSQDMSKTNPSIRLMIQKKK